LQALYGRTGSALAFYRNQVLDYLNSAMQVFIARQEMMFVATADRHGEADASFRAGTQGFVRVLDERTVAYPEYQGNGVMASLGNLSENSHLGILFIDFTGDKIGLDVFARRLFDRPKHSEASVIHEEVNPAEPACAIANTGCHALRSSRPFRRGTGHPDRLKN
jgi:predicted pyridoxine 5'-phosphate oxidase superfamily flavin-nucleotide-binding protein